MTHNGPVVVVAAQSCWRCGLAIPNGLVYRRVMVTGTSHQTSYGTGVFWTNEARREVVSLCPMCEDEVAAEEAAQRERQARRQRLVWSVIGGALFTVCAADAGIPWLLSLLVAVVLAVGGVLGRTLLMVVGTAWVLEYVGYNLRTNPEAMFPYFLLIIGGLMVSALVRKALTQWQVPERLVKKQQPPGQVLPWNAPKGKEGG